MAGFADELLGDNKPKAGGFSNELLDASGATMGPAKRELPQYIGDDPARMPSTAEVAAGSLPTDTMAKVKYYAKSLFPDQPLEQSLDNFFFKEGRLAYTGADGVANYAEPSFGLSGDAGQIMGQNAKALAGQAGPGLVTIPATAAGIATAEFAGGVPAATVVAGGMSGVRQFLSNIITGEEKSLAARAAQIGGDMLQEGAGQLMGVGMGKALGPKIGLTPKYDIPAVTDLGDKAAKFDIPLTAGEQTGNRSLIRRQKVLHNTTNADQTFEDFYKLRNEKVGVAVTNLLDTISKAPSVREGAGSGVAGSIEALATARKGLQEQASPLYKEALADGNVIDPNILSGAGDVSPFSTAEAGILQYAQRAARRDPVLGKVIGESPENSMYALDATKKYIDGMISKSAKEGNKFKTSTLTGVKEKLLGVMDEAQPKYGQARAIYEEGMPAVTQVERGIVGDAAKLEANDVLNAPRIIFGPGSSAADVRIAREAFNKAGQQDAWNDLTKSWLQQTFEAIKDVSANGSVVNVGGTFRKAIMGSPKQREILQAALEHNPEALKNMNWMMDVLDATGRAMKGESITAFAQMGQKELAQEARGLGPKVLDTIEVWKQPSRVANYLADIQTGKYAEQQAKLLTSPEGLQKLKELRKLSPSSTGAITSLSHLLMTYGVGEASDAMSGPKDGYVTTPGGRQ